MINNRIDTRSIGSIIILVVQKKSTPFRNPKNSGGSPKGVSAPPILATRKIKNTIVCTVCSLQIFARNTGRIKSIAAPVVPIQDASIVPINISIVLLCGVPGNLPFILIPPDIVYSEISRIINGEQKINGTTFDLTKEDEFTAISVEPFLGVEARYFINDQIGLGLGYVYSKSFGVANSDTEKLNFNNSRLEFGVTVRVY